MIVAAVMGAAILSGCQSVDNEHDAQVLLIDCQTQKTYPLTEGSVSTGGELAPRIAVPKMELWQAESEIRSSGNIAPVAGQPLKK